jgi:hypothetical protein
MNTESREINKDFDQPKSVFVTTNFVQETEDGNVSHHEAKALAAVTHLERMLTEADIKCELPVLPSTLSSFLRDYLTAHELKNSKVDLAFFNGSPFGITMRVLKPAKTIVAITSPNMGVEQGRI